MFNILVLICATMLMLFDLFHFMHRFHTWTSAVDLFEKHFRLKRMGFFYSVLLLMFFMGYLTITVLFVWNGQIQSKEVGIVSQILFWGSVFVAISNHNLFLLFETSEHEKKSQISNLTMSLDGYIDSIPGGVHHCVADPELRVSYVSDGFTDITGYTMQDMDELFGGKYIGICYDEEDRGAFSSVIKRIMEDESHATLIYKIRHKGGRPIWVSENLRVVRDSSGIVHIFAVITDITMEKKQADVDGLTGLYNKTSFCMLAKKYLEAHPNQRVGLLMIDLNSFKSINDRFGHPKGDEALRKTADFLKESLNERNCIIGRAGGDEFMVLVKDATSESDLNALKEELTMKFRIDLPDGEQTTQISGCIGGVYDCCEEGFEELYHRADQAMYVEKAGYHAKNG